eukprot:CAMPEP_0114986264 /NCGR_PEP_ID=MMETSP0216-20121206/8329_1 /TAXON_ID=223996 /ORGANISM="Protocruzia adherens, Strain Boccale" /LENGTH=896 /DNA_ID=CAMNT_0002348679 /DNA_START=38 /DNA_END=2728 /DNA_ORIENTATION=+
MSDKKSGKDQQASASKDKDATKNGKKDTKTKEVELSEEDKELEEKFSLLVERLQDSNIEICKTSLDTIKTEVRTATTSMTSVPKPLKFLGSHYGTIKSYYEGLKDREFKKQLADLLSVLAITSTDAQEFESLNFILEGHPEEITKWGHEYIRSLSGEIGREYNNRLEKNEKVDELIGLVKSIIPFLMSQNAEPEVIDLLFEVEQLGLILEYINENNYKRVGLYLSSCSAYSAHPDEMIEALKTCYKLYFNREEYPMAIRIALRLNSMDLIKEVFEACKDDLTKKQICYMMARQNVNFETEDDDLLELIFNSSLSENFLGLGKDLDVLEPKHPEDIYKSHLEEGNNRLTAAKIDSAKQNLASTYVSAFVNAGFGKDKLLLAEGENWINRNKDSGRLTAAASLGMVSMWDINNALTLLDTYQYSNDNHEKAGAMLGFGLASASVKDENDPALALLSENLENSNTTIKICSIMGLGLAYGGSARTELLETMNPLILDISQPASVSAYAALSLGLIFVGTCNEEVAQCIVQTLMERNDEQLGIKKLEEGSRLSIARYFSLGLGLLYLGQQEASEATVEALGIIEGPIGQYTKYVVNSCAYSGTGNVLKIQEMLHSCVDHLEEKSPVESAFQGVAVIGIAAIAAGEDIGTEMTMRTMGHLLQYGEENVKMAVPLALALMYVSNPQVTVIDFISKLCHDPSNHISQTSIFAMGIIGAGTNNARLAGLLRQLASYYQKDADHLFLVRIAQGLVHMGKGLISLQPFHSDRFLLNNVGFGGLLAVLHSMLDLDETILGGYHYSLYFLAAAMYPRMLVTVDEELKPITVSVRVGTAVDVVAQAGHPKSITGFQTHNTPVLLSFGDRAELATDEYLPVSSVLENFIILKKNPDYKPEETKPTKKKRQ